MTEHQPCASTWTEEGGPSGVQMSLALCAICPGAGRDASDIRKYHVLTDPEGP